MNKNYKKIYLVLVLIALAFLVVLAVKMLVTRTRVDNHEKNPYQFDVGKYKTVPESLIAFRELKKIDLALELPRGIAVDSKDRIYVTGDKQLLLFDENDKLQKTVSLEEPAGALTVAKNGHIFISFPKNISIFDRDGKLVQAWEPFASGSIITSIAVTDTFVFAADAGNKFVWKLDLNGKPVAEIGKKDEKKGIPVVVIPSPYFDTLIDAEKHLWMVNPGMHKLEQFTLDGSLVSMWGKSGMQIENFCGCCNPTHIANFANGDIVTSEKGLSRVKLYDKNGTFLSVVAGPEQFEDDTTGLDLAVDSKNRVLVLDPVMKAVRIFVRKRSNEQ